MTPHRTDGVSLAFGLAFLGAAALWLITRLIPLGAAAVGWLVAGGLIVLGGLGVVHAVVRSGRGSRRHAGE